MQIDIAREDTNAALTFAGWGAVVIISLVLIGLAALGGSIYVIVLQVVRPLQSMTNVMTSLAGGQNRIEVLGHDRTDEIGEMARAVLVFCTAAVTQEQAAAEKAAADVEQQRVVSILAWKPRRHFGRRFQIRDQGNLSGVVRATSLRFQQHGLLAEQPPVVGGDHHRFDLHRRR